MYIFKFYFKLNELKILEMVLTMDVLIGFWVILVYVKVEKDWVRLNEI